MPPAAKNPFVKGFLDLPKLFIRFTTKSFWKSRNLFEKRFLDFQKLLFRVIFEDLNFFLTRCVTLWLKNWQRIWDPAGESVSENA